MLPRGAWNGHEKAGRHFLEHQLRLLAGWDGGDIFLDPNSCPRVFLNNPPGLSSGSVWVMRIGMCGRRGKRPVMPSLPFAGPETLRRPFEGNSRSYTPRPSVFEGVQAYRLPGPKPSACLSKATLAATRHGHLFLRAFKACRLPFKRSCRPFKSNSRSYTPRPSVFKGVQACRLPGPKPFKPSRRPFEGNSRGYTPRPSVFKSVQAYRLPGPKPFKTLPQAFRKQLSQLHATLPFAGPQTLRKPFEGNSRSYTPRPSVFKGVQACRLPGPKPSAGLSKATLAATHHGHLFLRRSSLPFCRATNPPQAFRRQLSQLHTTAICF